MDWASVMDWLYLAALFASLALVGMWVREREYTRERFPLKG